LDATELVITTMDYNGSLVAVSGLFMVDRGVWILFQQSRYNVFWGGADGRLIIIKRGHFNDSS
jgi:hypothetical protein